MKDRRIILGVTGSIAAYKAAELASALVREGAEATAVMTEAAQRFVTPLTFETLTHRPVVTDMWTRTAYREPVHVELAEWGDLMVVAPASANFIGKCANGIADDMLTCLALAVREPPVIAPAMNDVMYRHAAVQENLDTLKRRGCPVIEPAEGRLASGKIGVGRLAPVDDILAVIREELGKRTR